jgi:hypothetical protein
VCTEGAYLEIAVNYVVIVAVLHTRDDLVEKMPRLIC